MNAVMREGHLYSLVAEVMGIDTPRHAESQHRRGAVLATSRAHRYRRIMDGSRARHISSRYLLSLMFAFLASGCSSDPRSDEGTHDFGHRTVSQTLDYAGETLTASDAAAGDHFGHAVAIDGDTLAVSALDAEIDGEPRGAVYIFERVSDVAPTWQEVQKLVPEAGRVHFGQALALEGGRLFVADGSAMGAGQVDVYDRTVGPDGEWGFVKTLSVNGLGVGGVRASALAVSGDTLIVNAFYMTPSWGPTGSAFIFERNQGGTDEWGFVKELKPTDGLIGSSYEFNYGQRLAIDGDIAVVGANSTGDTNFDVIYVYERNTGGASNWGEEKLVGLPAVEPGIAERIGIDGTTLYVGMDMRWGQATDIKQHGSVQIFERDTDGPKEWGYVSELYAEDGLVPGNASGKVMDFGQHLDVQDDLLLVGSDYAAWRFERVADAWELTGAQSHQTSGFGRALAAGGEAYVMGAPLGTLDFDEQGTAIVHQPSLAEPEEPGPSDPPPDVPVESSGTSEDGGCSVGAPPSSGQWQVWLLGLGLMLRRRRR